MNNENIEEVKNDFKYKLVKKIGLISVNPQGWTKEVNLVSYNGKKAVVDIRLWSPNRRMSKGITLKKEDVSRLLELLNELNKEIKDKENKN